MLSSFLSSEYYYSAKNHAGGAAARQRLLGTSLGSHRAT
eukprot:COSAG02_NODE_18832_length_915_cov_162.590686_2_plen_38_part_01